MLFHEDLEDKFFVILMIRYLTFAGVLWALGISEHYMIDAFWIWLIYTLIQMFITPA